MMRQPVGFQAIYLGALAAFAGGFVLFPAQVCLAQAAPSVACVFPAGGQRGDTVEVTVIGGGLLGASDVYVSGSGVSAKIVGEEQTGAAPKPAPRGGAGDVKPPKPWNNLQVANHRVRLALEIDPDAALGPRDVRLVTPGGLTPRIRFLVDQLPEIVVTQPNDSPEEAVGIPALPVVANGQLYSGWIGSIAIRGTPDRAFFRFPAKAGQTLVCQVQARELIPFIDQAVPGFLDACVSLRDGNGARLRYVDDFRFSPDPVLLYSVERDGDYQLEVRDVIYRSHHDFIYRMRLGELPYLTHVYPLGGRRGTEVQLELYGVNLPADRLTVKIPADGPDVQDVQVERDGLLSNTLPLAVDDLPEIHEAEPNDESPAAQIVSLPVVINGRVAAPGDADWFAFQAEAGQTLSFEVQARRLGSPLDSLLTLWDAEGRVLARHDDPAPQAVPNAQGTGVENDSGATIHPRDALLMHRADSLILHTFAVSGRHVVSVGDVAEHGGPEYAYRLRIAPAEKDFALRVATDAASVVAGDSASVTVSLLRKAGFDGPVRVEAHDLPTGFTAAPALIAAGQTTGQLTISVPAGAAPGRYAPSFLGTAEIDGRSVQRPGIPVETVGQAFYIKHQVPTEGFLLHVSPTSHFTVSSDVPPGNELELPKGGEVKIVVRAERLEGGKGPIALSAVVPPGIVVKPVQIGPAQDEATLTVTATPQASSGLSHNLVITGTLRIGPEFVVRTLPAIPVRVVGN
jgi:hypothetical protein